MKNIFYRIAVVGLVLTMSMTTATGAEAPASSNPLALDERAVKEAGIVIDTAAPQPFSDELKAPGEVKVNAYSTVLVSPRIEAQVLARKVKLGDVVKAGQPLVVLSSVSVAETQGALIVAEQDWQRVASLGVQAVSGRRYNEVKVLRDEARAKLRAYGMSDGQIGALLRAGSSRADGSFELLSPTDGRITTDEFLVGERVEPGRTLFTVVKEDTIWVEAQLPPAAAERVAFDAPARIVAHDSELPGKVIQRAHQTSERTRTAPVRIEVDNRRDLLHPGELVDVRIAVGATASTLALPVKAIVLLQSQPTIFVPSGKNTFEPVAVMTGETRDGWVEIKEGLKPGTAYVREGAFALKARLLRSKLGED